MLAQTSEVGERYVQYELQYCGLLQRARASGRRAQKTISLCILRLRIKFQKNEYMLQKKNLVESV